MMIATLENPPPITDEKSPADVCTALGELSENCRSQSQFYREALKALSKHYGSPYASICVTHSTSTVDEHVTAEGEDSTMWVEAVEEALLESQATNTPIARLYGMKGTALKVAVLAVPVQEQANRPVGAVSLIVRCDDKILAKTLMGELAALVSLIGTRAGAMEAKPATPEDDNALKRAIMKASDFQSLHELAFAITNTLKNKFNCDQVIFGKAEEGSIRVLSISGLDNIYPKSPGVKHICQAMEECLDAGKTICYQDEGNWAEESVATNHHLHKHWHNEVGNVPVASIPLMLEGQCIAVLSMSRSKKLSFSKEELAKINETVTPFAPAVLLVSRADRGLWRHSIDVVKKGVAWLLAPRTYQRKVIAAVILLGFLFFCFGKIHYEVTVPTQIVPTEIVCYASPFEGSIKACYAEVGDEVTKGQLLYKMDTADLQLQKEKLESELGVLRVQVNQAFSSEDAKAAAMARAEIEVVQAQLSLIKHNLSMAEVHAPSAGTIVSGELSKRIGEVVSMGTPLLEFVPKGDWSIELLVPETMVADLQVGYRGQFACNARPSEHLNCKITQIRPSTEPIDGKNIFIAEATVESNPLWMRTGMEGVAQIDTGKRRVWWVSLHRIIDYIQMKFWL